MNWLTLYKQIFKPYIALNSQLDKDEKRPAILENAVSNFTGDLVMRYTPNQVQIQNFNCTNSNIIIDIVSTGLSKQENITLKSGIHKCRLTILNDIKLAVSNDTKKAHYENK